MRFARCLTTGQHKALQEYGAAPVDSGPTCGFVRRLRGKTRTARSAACAVLGQTWEGPDADVAGCAEGLHNAILEHVGQRRVQRGWGHSRLSLHKSSVISAASRESTCASSSCSTAAREQRACFPMRGVM